MAENTVKLHRVLRAPAERIYRAFLDADAMAKWLPPHGFTGKVHQMDARVGGGYRMSFTNLTTGEENYDKNLWAARGTVEFEPSAEAFFRISGDYTKDTSQPRGGHRLIPGIVSGAPVLDDVYDTRAGLVSPAQEVEEAGAEGVARESRMLAAARSAGVRLIGPNCLGFVNIHDNVFAGFGLKSFGPFPASMTTRWPFRVSASSIGALNPVAKGGV